MEDFVLRERLADKNGWQHYVYQADECVLHGTYAQARVIPKWFCHHNHNTASSCMHVEWIPKTYLTFNLAIVKNYSPV